MLKSECNVRRKCNERKKKTKPSKQAPPPPTFIEWLAFSCIKHEENDKMSKGLASKVFIMEVATTLQFHAGVFLRSEYCTCQLHVQSPLVSQNDTLVTIWLQYHSDGELSVNMSTLENTDVVRRLAVLKRR